MQTAAKLICAALAALAAPAFATTVVSSAAEALYANDTVDTTVSPGAPILLALADDTAEAGRTDWNGDNSGEHSNHDAHDPFDDAVGDRGCAERASPDCHINTPLPTGLALFLSGLVGVGLLMRVNTPQGATTEPLRVRGRR